MPGTSPSWGQTPQPFSRARLPWMIASSWPSPISSIEPRLLSSRLCAPAIRSKLNSEAKAPLLGTTNTGTTFVVGAGGSIGCALLQALASNHPRFLILLDYAEQNLHEINLQLAASGKSSYAAVSGDILDGPLMTEISDRYRPPTIHHAAVLGVYPDEQITSRDGGMIVTNDSKVDALAKKLCNHGPQRIRRMVPAGKSWATTTDSPN